ncbi:hypothetical protein ACGFOM_38230 [Streptomyces sp. NPDC048594]|uniref:hypothetical protein n=1 Tax=Streptomyces sp. NPDC048594 TaxID=3365575 RepID=UPI003718E336
MVEHLTADPLSPRDIKYAVLHLQAAAEVLLKARLVREHWSLVFDDPGTASEKAFRSGGFKSCTVGDAVTRLRNIVGAAVTDKEYEALSALGRDRNSLQHYGLSHNARALEARAGRVLDFLVHFLDVELLPGLAATDSHAIELDMVRVRLGLTKVQTFITQRMRRLLGELRGQEHRTTLCPSCGHPTFVAEASQDGGARCLFCNAAYSARDIVVMAYLDDVEKNGRNIGSCPVCSGIFVVHDTWLATGDRVSFCFSCARALPGQRPEGEQ